MFKGHCSFGGPIRNLTNILDNVLKCCLNISTYVIFWSVSILPAVKYPNNRLSVIQFSSVPSFFPNINMVINGQAVQYLFHWIRGYISCLYANCILAFLYGFWCSDSFFADQNFNLCQDIWSCGISNLAGLFYAKVFSSNYMVANFWQSSVNNLCRDNIRFSDDTYNFLPAFFRQDSKILI